MVCLNYEYYISAIDNKDLICDFTTKPTEYQKKLLKAVNKLPIVCRKVVILYALRGMQRQEIADLMQISTSALRFLIYRSGLMLHKDLCEIEADSKLGNSLNDSRLRKIFFGWPYSEYAELVELRKILIFLI